MVADVSRISVTAKLSAYYRQFSDIAFAAEAATWICAEDAFTQLARDHNLDRDKLTFYAPMFEARYKSVSELIRKSGATQVLELACGYSLRGLDLTQRDSIDYVETDLRDVVTAKRELVDEIRHRHAIPPSPRHHLTVADALDLPQLQTAVSVLARDRPLVVLCEGLMGYLGRSETERVAANIHSLLGGFSGGSWIVPDFAFKAEIRDLPPERLRLREAVTGITQRQLDASAFEDHDHLVAFFGQLGFFVQVHRQVDETPSFASIDRLGLDPSLVERLRPTLRVWTMTPAG